MARDFSSQKGAISQEYFVYSKKAQRVWGGKAPPASADDLFRGSLKRYFVEEDHKTGRPSYDREKLLKVVLFAFMEEGYKTLRKMEKLCKTDIRFMWLLDEEPAPSHMTISNFLLCRAA